MTNNLTFMMDNVPVLRLLFSKNTLAFS